MGKKDGYHYRRNFVYIHLFRFSGTRIKESAHLIGDLAASWFVEVGFDDKR